MQNRDRLFYQYALMNLAVLQADFGCHKEAVDAMLETVTTARENRDMMCLNFALNWLFHFGLAHPGLVQGGNLESSGSTFGSGKETMAFLRVKARETGMWTLWSSALLSEAHMALAQGDSVATALEHLVRSEHILVERNMCSLLGPQRAVAVAVWDRLGVSSLATLTCDVFLRCHASSPARRVGASGTAVGSAGVSPGSGSTNDGTVIFDDELRMVCRAADFLARKGRFDAATGLLESAVDSNALRSARAAADHACHRAIVQLRRDLHRGDLDGAEHLLVQLRGSVGARRVDISTRGGPEDDDEVLSANGELGLAIELLHVDYLTRRGDLGAAMAAVEALLSSVTISTDVEARTSLLLHKANLYVLAGRPARGFSLSLRAASLALRSRALPELWLACRHIATVLCSLREFSAAAKLLAAVLPRVLETDDMFAAGAMYAVLADAYVGLAGDGVPAAAVASVGSEHKRPGSAAGVSAGEKERREWLNRAMETLGRADSCFAAVEDVSARCEVVAKMAVVMRVSGDGPAAAGYAAKYADLRRLAAAYANGGG